MNMNTKDIQAINDSFQAACKEAAAALGALSEQDEQLIEVIAQTRATLEARKAIDKAKSVRICGKRDV